MRAFLLTLFVVASLLLGQAIQDDVRTLADQAAALLKNYREHGQTDTDRTALLNFFGEHDTKGGDDPAYLLLKAHSLEAIGEETEALAVFNRVPDAALTLPTDLHNRLQRRFITNPADAVPLALKLASTSEVVFTDWVHKRVWLRVTRR